LIESGQLLDPPKPALHIAHVIASLLFFFNKFYKIICQVQYK
jgi:hypothetical protein